MVTFTTEKTPSKEVIQISGIARGSAVRTRNIGSGIFAGLKNIVVREPEGYEK
ncbi:heavy metal-binding domain-containing protein [Aquimarina sp. M1]